MPFCISSLRIKRRFFEDRLSTAFIFHSFFIHNTTFCCRITPSVPEIQSYHIYFQWLFKILFKSPKYLCNLFVIFFRSNYIKIQYWRQILMPTVCTKGHVYQFMFLRIFKGCKYDKYYNFNRIWIFRSKNCLKTKKNSLK